MVWEKPATSYTWMINYNDIGINKMGKNEERKLDINILNI